MSSTEAISTTSLSSTSSVTTTETSTSGELPPLDLGANDLGGYVFHDYNGNGALDEGEPFVNDVEIVAQGYYATFKVKPQSGIYVFKNLPGDQYRLYPVHPQNKFRYMCRSNAELVETKQGYSVNFLGNRRLDMALMEGFLTLPVAPGTRYEIDRFYDRDPNLDRYLWWNGLSGLDRNMKRGFSPNHPGIDYYISEGNPLPSPAPGRVRAVVEDDPGGKFVLIDHLNGFLSSCGHISKATVNQGDLVSRGQTIAMSGKSGQATELANYPHNHFQIVFNEHILVDAYRATFKMTLQYSGYYSWGTTPFPWVATPIDSSPNTANHWTKDNDPQFSAP